MYRKAFNGWLKHWDFLLLDIACLQLAYLIIRIAMGANLVSFRTHMYRDEGIILLVCDLLVVFFSQPYKNILRRGWKVELLKTLQHAVLVMMVNIIYLYLVHQGHFFSRRLFVQTGLMYLGLSFVARTLLKRYLLRRNRRRGGDHAMVIVTASTWLDRVIREINEKTFKSYVIPAIFLMDVDDPEQGLYKGAEVYGKKDSIVDYICHRWVDEVYIKLPSGRHLSSDVIDKLLNMGVTTHFTLSMLERTDGGEHYLEKFGQDYVVTSGLKIVSTNQMMYKRLVDIIGALLGCAVTGILLLIVGPMIKRQSPGPVFFTQERVGRNGKTFLLYKFRSMEPGADEQKQEMMEQNEAGSDLIFKIKEDPRIIGSEKKDRKGRQRGLGHFLRRTSIDEFPQFWNVLKGDMSLVGTRPPTLDEWERYDIEHRARMSIKPGITGLWQVSGRSKITDFDEIVRLDTDYIRNWSLGLDLRILLKTVKVVLKREGAA